MLPGVSRLARLVARQRDAATARPWETVSAALTVEQRMALDALLVVPPGGRVSQLERWRTGPVRASGPQMVKALRRVAEIIGSGLSRVGIEAAVTPRRLAELARYGMGADVAQLKRHGQDRRMATLVATVAQLEATAVDDALDLLDLFMTTELIGKAHQDTDKQTIKTHPKLASAAVMLVVIAEVLFEASKWGDEDEVRLSQVWEAIEARIPRERVRAAAATVAGMVPPPEAISDGNWRAELAKRIAAVSGFVKMLTTTIEFGATAAGAPVLAAMRAGRAVGVGGQVDGAQPAYSSRGGERPVAAPSFRPPGPRRRLRGSGRCIFTANDQPTSDLPKKSRSRCAAGHPGTGVVRGVGVQERAHARVIPAAAAVAPRPDRMARRCRDIHSTGSKLWALLSKGPCAP